MGKLIVKEICKNLKWHERIIVKIFSRLFVKVYNNERIALINHLLKN